MLGRTWLLAWTRTSLNCVVRRCVVRCRSRVVAALYVRFCPIAQPNSKSRGKIKHLLLRLMRTQQTKPSHPTKATIVYMRMKSQTCSWRWLVVEDRRPLDTTYKTKSSNQSNSLEASDFVIHISHRLHGTGVCARVKRMTERVIGDMSNVIW